MFVDRMKIDFNLLSYSSEKFGHNKNIATGLE